MHDKARGSWGKNEPRKYARAEEALTFYVTIKSKLALVTNSFSKQIEKTNQKFGQKLDLLWPFKQPVVNSSCLTISILIPTNHETISGGEGVEEAQITDG